jgi:phosphatidylserine/phosphatidylglycerophosphate/cardiolipin synthase-like enzyme
MPDRGSKLRELVQAFRSRNERDETSGAAGDRQDRSPEMASGASSDRDDRPPDEKASPDPEISEGLREVGDWRVRMQSMGLLGRTFAARGLDRVAAVGEVAHLLVPAERMARLRAARWRVRVAEASSSTESGRPEHAAQGVVVLDHAIGPDDDGVVMHRPARAGLYEIHTEYFDAHGSRLSGSSDAPPLLQVIDGRPTFAIDVDLVLARPSAGPVLWALREAGCELFYFDLAERDRTVELRAELHALGAPPAAVMTHSKDTAEVRTLGVDFRAVFLTATLRRLRGAGVPVVAVVSEHEAAVAAAARTQIDRFEELNPARRAVNGYLCHAGRPPTSIAARLDRMTRARSVEGNAFHVELDNRRARQRLFVALERAQHSIHLEYYLVRDGVFGDQLAARLVRAARRGVRVRLLVDALYSIDGVAGATNALARGLVAEPSIEVVSAQPIASRVDLEALLLKRRDHRKIVTVDAQLAFVGGRNASDEYYTGFDEVAITDWTPHHRIPWLDAHVEVRGPLVGAVERAFVARWIEAGGAPPGGVIEDPPPAGSSPARLVLHDGVDDAAAMLAYEALIDGATSHVWVVNDFPIVPSLQLALRRALHRGVRVRLLTGCAVPRRQDGSFLPGPLHREAFEYMTKKRLEPLLRAGAEVWEHVVEPHPLIVCRGGTVRPYVHAKLVSADGRVLNIGSANLDATASYWEREANVVVEDPAVARAVEGELAQMCARGVPVDPSGEQWRREGLLRELASQLWPETLYS